MLGSQTITNAEQAAPNTLNFNQGPDAVFPGTYTTTVPNDSVTYFNQAMMVQAEHFDPFIQQSLIEQPRFWYNMIPRGAYPNFQGYKQETRIYRGGPVHYAGLADWADIDPVPVDGTNNPCGPRSYTTQPYAWERLEWAGKDRYWGSDPVCLNQLRFIDQATEQLAWILQSGADYGISLQEVWNRDKLLDISVSLAGRSFVMTSTYVGNSTAERFYYDPFTTAAQVTDVETKAGLTANKPFVVFKYQEVEPINFDVLDALHDGLQVDAPRAAIGSNSGVPMYGLPIANKDFERYIKGNSYEIANWREARPEQLIQGMMGMNYKQHRNYSIMFDENQFRMKILKVVTNYASASYNGVGSDLEGETVIVAQFVPPRVEGRIGENGQAIMEHNPDYITAELALMPIMMKDIFYNLFSTELNTLGSNTFFGPQAGLNGTWKWINIADTTNNPESLIGNFRGKFEIWAKPSPNAVHATSFLYRRCVEPLKSRCPVANSDVNYDMGDSPQESSSYTVTSSVAADDTLNATVLLPTKLGDAYPGNAITIEVTGAGPLDGTDLSGYIMRVASTPEYAVALSGVTGLVAADPGVGGESTGYYIADGVLTYRDDTEVTPMVFATFTLV